MVRGREAGIRWAGGQAGLRVGDLSYEPSSTYRIYLHVFSQQRYHQQLHTSTWYCIYFQEQRCLENTGVLPGIGRGYSIYVGSNHAHPRTAHELAHLSRIAQDFKICVDELRPIAQPGKTCIAHHVAPIAHSGPNELARVAPIAHAGKYGQMSYSP